MKMKLYQFIIENIQKIFKNQLILIKNSNLLEHKSNHIIVPKAKFKIKNYHH